MQVYDVAASRDHPHCPPPLQSLPRRIGAVNGPFDGNRRQFDAVPSMTRQKLIE
jgi:hypothetical protein